MTIPELEGLLVKVRDQNRLVRTLRQTPPDLTQARAVWGKKSVPLAWVPEGYWGLAIALY